MYSDNHWFSDTFLSAAIGIAVGNAFVTVNEERDTNKNNNLSIMPYYNPYSTGIMISYTF